MAADRCLTFDTTSLQKYATSEHFLNRGASGDVYGPIHLHGLQLAIKQAMFADGKVTDEFKERIEQKKEIWTSLQHKHLTRIYSVDLTRLPKVMFIAMEFAAGGSLYKTLRSLGSENKLPIDVVTNWAKQIADGMLYLHEKNIVHRDLKSSNILLIEPFNACNSSTFTTLKIADFDDIKENDHTTTMSLVGTCAYMAPEVLQNQWFSKASDVWSYGVVLWEMLSGDIPHKDLEPKAIMYKSMSGELANLSLEQSFPEHYKLILNKCSKKDYTERPSFYDIFCDLEIIGHINTLIPLIPVPANDRYRSIPETIVIKQRIHYYVYGIGGITVLDDELFILIYGINCVEVYDLIEFCLLRTMMIPELKFPTDITSSPTHNHLYIIAYSGDSQNKIVTIDRNGTVLNEKPAGDDFGCLSVTKEFDILLAVWNGNPKILVYNMGADLYQTIELPSDFFHPWHAVKLNNGQFLVSHGHRHSKHRVCIINETGDIINEYGGKSGAMAEQLNSPYHLAVDSSGYILVSDIDNSRIVLFDPNLKFIRELISLAVDKRFELRKPVRMHFDEPKGRLYIADNVFDLQKDTWKDGRFWVFEVM